MSNVMLSQLLNASWETAYMVLLSGLIATLLGLPIGVLLATTRKHGILANRVVNAALSAIVNVMRSIPFIILMIAVIPLTRILVGTSIGTVAAIVPLSLGATPFIARLIENAVADLPYGLTEAGLAMGATPSQIIKRILLPEALPNIIHSITITLITLVGYSAMAGAIGGGGLGSLAINYGYQRFDVMVMLVTIVILVVFVQLLQWLGDRIAQAFNHG